MTSKSDSSEHKWSTIDIVQSVGLVVSLVFSGYALYSSSRTNEIMQCFEEFVPKSIANINTYQQISNELRIAENNYFENLIELKLLTTDTLDFGEEAGHKFLIRLTQTITQASLGIENFKSSIKPYIDGDEFENLEKLLVLADADDVGSDPEKQLIETIEFIGQYGPLYKSAVSFIQEKIRVETSRSISKRCNE